MMRCVFLPFCGVFIFASVPAFTYFYHKLYLCHSARRLSNADCFSAAVPTNSLCCLWRSATSSSSWLLLVSLFKAELSATSPGFSCSMLWHTSWSKQKCCLYWSDTQDKNWNRKTDALVSAHYVLLKDFVSIWWWRTTFNWTIQFLFEIFHCFLDLWIQKYH